MAPQPAFCADEPGASGTHTRVHETVAAALDAVAAMVGRTTDNCGHPLRVGGTYYSDWGKGLVVEEWPAEHTARTEDLLRAAYDARECGTATAQQLALLERHRR